MVYRKRYYHGRYIALEVPVKPDAALKKLEDAYGARRALTLVGFAMFVEMHGAKAMREKYDRMTVWRDLKALKDAGVEPNLIDWGEVDSGGGKTRATPHARRRTAAV